MIYATGYFTRDSVEYEVSAKLYEHGKAEEGMDDLGGIWWEAIDDPIFIEFVAFDDWGVEMTLTPKELHNIEEQMIDQYWKDYENGDYNEEV